METWQVPASSGANMLFVGKGPEVHTPNTKGVSRFRPLARPYPDYIKSLVPELMPKAKELAKSVDVKSDQFRGQLRMMAKEVTDKHNVHMVIVDADRDLANCVRQTIMSNGVIPAMEWWRHGVGQCDIGSWALSLEIASYWGMNMISAFDHTKMDPKYTPDEKVCAEQFNNVGVFRKTFNELSAGAKIDPRWNSFIKVFGSQAKGAQAPQRKVLVQCYLFEQNNIQSPTPIYCVFMINSSALSNLEAQWNMPGTGPGGKMPDDFVNGFKCGNILDPRTGSTIIIYDQNAIAQQYTGGAFGGGFGMGRQKKGPQTNYVAQFAPQELDDSFSIAAFKQWDSFINIPTRKEAWELVLKAMGPHATAYAGRSEIVLLPQAIRELANQYNGMGSQQTFGGPQAPQTFGGPRAPQGFGAPQAPQGFGAPQAPQGFGGPLPQPGQFAPPAAPSFAPAAPPALPVVPGFAIPAPAAPSFGSPTAPGFGQQQISPFGAPPTDIPGAAASPGFSFNGDNDLPAPDDEPCDVSGLDSSLGAAHGGIANPF